MYIKIYLNTYRKIHYTKKITKSIKVCLLKIKITIINNTSVKKTLNQ